MLDAITNLILAYPLYSLAAIGLILCLGGLAYYAFEDYWSTITYEDQIGAQSKSVERGVIRATKSTSIQD